MRGFTLVETLVSLGIAAVLATLALTGASSAKRRAEMIVEVGAAKNLVSAYVAHASENGGKMMPGYRSDPETLNLAGEKLHHPMNARYPWRLMPYLEKVKGVMFYNGSEKYLDDENSDYLVSVAPNLGMNTVFVGGHFGSGSPLRPSERMIERVGKFYVDRLHEIYDPSQLVVFSSARHGKEIKGYFEVRPPKLFGPEWSSRIFIESMPAMSHGFVDFRWQGRAVVATFDGRAELLREDQLRDMRRWSNEAARENDPEYTIPR